MQYNASVIKGKIDEAIRTLLNNDLFLLSNDSDEWSISHKLAEYLQYLFSAWNVDTEYNRDKNRVKKLGSESVRPDIIVHKRSTANNLLVIEIKKSNNLDSIENDRRRLGRFTSPEGEYGYQFGALIIFYVAEEYWKSPSVELFKDGKHLR